MAITKYIGPGAVADTDYHFVKWVGKTKGGQAVSIVIPRAFCRSSLDLKFTEKNDVVPELEFEGVYLDENLAIWDRTEPWHMTVADGVTPGNSEIVLGVGKFYVGKIAPEYSESKAYEVGDEVVHDDDIYECNTKITSPGEVWTAAHWTKTGPTLVGLTRGGGEFIIEREYREINADEDPGAVYGRMVQEGGRPKLKFNALQWLTKVTDLFAGFTTES